MKLLYTSLTNDLTFLLTKEAEQHVSEGKRVFYIAPNSLSFEKERKVLESLNKGASFDITVTRFGQMARYLVLNSVNPKESLDDIGLSMLMFKALSSLSDSDLKVYHRLKRDPNFLKQLVDLYKELKRSNLALTDLEHLDDAIKASDLLLIFSRLERLIAEGNFDNQTKLAFLSHEIVAGKLDHQLSNLVIIIEGFTRFSAEEEQLVTLLNDKCEEVVVGVYASEKAYKANLVAGNIYQASVDFLRDLATKFAIKPNYLEGENEATAFSRLSQLVESAHDFTASGEVLNEEDCKHFAIWEIGTQREEIEEVARSIRHLLANGIRYKDILVLLGDVDSYHLQVGNIFRKFDIPHYFAKTESMSAHPLVNFIDTLERLKRYRYRSEDLLNLLKTGLLSSFCQSDIDRFEQYVRYADINGFAAFNRDFTANTYLKTVDIDGDSVKVYRYDLEKLNLMRQELMTPLASFLAVKKQKGTNLLVKFITFIEQIQFSKNLQILTSDASELELEKHEQVWSTFTKILHQMQTIFAEEILSVDDFLALLRSALFASDYRTVPATIDVVTVKSYDLVEPHSAKYVFSIGMTQNNFPKIVDNNSLISDQERAKINEMTDGSSRLDILSMENIKKNHFAALSLFNAASEQLVLSFPKLFNGSEGLLSNYLQELNVLGVPLIEKRGSHQAQSERIGHYRDILAQAIAINRGELDKELTKDEQTFWSVAVRFLRHKLESQQVLVPQILDEIKVKRVSSEVMEIKFPKEEPIRLSVSGLTTFYNNEYLYFVRYVLGLEEVQSVNPDARAHGQYLHRIFEQLLTLKPNSADFDKTLEKTISRTKSEQSFLNFYQTERQENQLSLCILEDIARSTASFLKRLDSDYIKAQEERFSFAVADKAKLNGVIDRVDQLADGSYGVVDYKSGDTKFDIELFYNGLNSQLVTYLQALKNHYGLTSEQLFGAMYLHMQEPQVSLSDIKSTEQILLTNQSSLTYQGIFSEEEKAQLADGSYKIKNNLYTTDQLDILLAHNEKLFTNAVDTIRSGQFAINPYTKDVKSVQGEQLRSITHFEADRHLLTNARRLDKIAKKDKLVALEMMKGEKHVD